VWWAQLDYVVGDIAWGQLRPTQQVPFMADRATFLTRSAKYNKVPLITDVVRLHTRHVSADNVIKAFLCFGEAKRPLMRQQLTAVVPKYMLALDETFNSAKQFGGKTLANVVQEDGDPVVSLLNSADMPTGIKGAKEELIEASKREGCCVRLFCTDNWKVGVDKLKSAADALRTGGRDAVVKVLRGTVYEDLYEVFPDFLWITLDCFHVMQDATDPLPFKGSDYMWQDYYLKLRGCMRVYDEDCFQRVKALMASGDIYAKITFRGSVFECGGRSMELSEVQDWVSSGAFHKAFASSPNNLVPSKSRSIEMIELMFGEWTAFLVQKYFDDQEQPIKFDGKVFFGNVKALREHQERILARAVCTHVPKHQFLYEFRISLEPKHRSGLPRYQQVATSSKVETFNNQTGRIMSAANCNDDLTTCAARLGMSSICRKRHDNKQTPSSGQEVQTDNLHFAVRANKAAGVAQPGLKVPMVPLSQVGAPGTGSTLIRGYEASFQRGGCSAQSVPGSEDLTHVDTPCSTPSVSVVAKPTKRTFSALSPATAHAKSTLDRENKRVKKASVPKTVGGVVDQKGLDKTFNRINSAPCTCSCATQTGGGRRNHKVAGDGEVGCAKLLWASRNAAARGAPGSAPSSKATEQAKADKPKIGDTEIYLSDVQGLSGSTTMFVQLEPAAGQTQRRKAAAIKKTQPEWANIGCKCRQCGGYGAMGLSSTRGNRIIWTQTLKRISNPIVKLCLCP
jgi:hypothetical protein